MCGKRVTIWCAAETVCAAGFTCGDGKAPRETQQHPEQVTGWRRAFPWTTEDTGSSANIADVVGTSQPFDIGCGQKKTTWSFIMEQSGPI